MAIDWDSTIIWNEDNRRFFSNKNVTEETVKKIFEAGTNNISVDRLLGRVIPNVYRIKGIVIAGLRYDLGFTIGKLDGEDYAIPLDVDVYDKSGKLIS